MCQDSSSVTRVCKRVFLAASRETVSRAAPRSARHRCSRRNLSGRRNPSTATDSIQEARRSHRHVKCELERWGPATGQFATLQIAGCCRNTDVFEKMETGEAYDMCVKDTIKVDNEGSVHMPTKPGLGLDFDLDEKRSERS